MTEYRRLAAGLKLFLLCCSMILLSACDNHRNIRDLESFVAQHKAETAATSSKKEVTLYTLPTPQVYRSDALRSPFDLTSVAFTQKKDVPPINAFPLNMLRFVGTLYQNGTDWAVIMVPDGKVYQVTIGDEIGDHYDKIKSIAPDHIDIGVEVSETSKHQTERIVTLELKEGNG